MYRECVPSDTFNWHGYLYLEPGFFDVAYKDRARLRAPVDPHFSSVIPRGLRTYWDLPGSTAAEGTTRKFQLSTEQRIPLLNDAY